MRQVLDIISRQWSKVVFHGPGLTGTGEGTAMPLTNDYERAAMLLLRAADDGALSLAGTGFAVMVDSETSVPSCGTST